jgi:hypothetical protein
MTNTALTRDIRELVEAFAKGVVLAVLALPVRELVEHRGRRARSAGTVTELPVTARRRPAARRPTTDTGSAAQLRAQALAVLERTKRWMAPSEIRRELPRPPHRQTLTRVLRELAEAGMVAKRGVTRATEYQVTKRGLDAVV